MSAPNGEQHAPMAWPIGRGPLPRDPNAAVDAVGPGSACVWNPLSLAQIAAIETMARPDASLRNIARSVQAPQAAVHAALLRRGWLIKDGRLLVHAGEGWSGAAEGWRRKEPSPGARWPRLWQAAVLLAYASAGWALFLMGVA